MDRNTKIGNYCKIERNVVIVQDVELGDYSYVGENTFCGSVKIGRYCSIGRNCSIGGYEHPLDLVSTSPRIAKKLGLKYNDIPERIVIKNDVWIGNNACIKGG